MANKNHIIVNSDSKEMNNESDSTLKDTVLRQKLSRWINKNLKIKMTDGRILSGAFLCTDRDANIILGVCTEYLSENSEGRTLGLVMVPGRHIVSIHLDT